MTSLSPLLHSFDSVTRHEVDESILLERVPRTGLPPRLEWTHLKQRPVMAHRAWCWADCLYPISALSGNTIPLCNYT